MRNVSLLVAIVLTTIFITGCGGPSMCTVTGTVTLDGQPAPMVSVVYMPVSPLPGFGANGTATTDDAGKYRIFLPAGKSKIPTGEYEVLLLTTLETPPTVVVPPAFAKQTVNVNKANFVHNIDMTR